MRLVIPNNLRDGGAGSAVQAPSLRPQACRSAFTLVELMVVLVIISITAATVTLRLEGPLRRATTEDVLQRIAAFDLRTRTLARGHDLELSITVDLARGELSRTSAADEHEELGSTLALPPDYRLAVAVVAGHPEATVGRVAVPCSRLGLTPSYAVCLEDRDGRRHWLLVAGLTGQTHGMESDGEVHEIFAALAAGADAD